MKTFRRTVIFWIVFSLGAGPVWAGGSFLWRIDSPVNSVYLFGSIHFGKKDFYPLPDEVEAAFEEAEVLVLEADIGKMMDPAVLKMTLDLGLLPEGETIHDHIEPKTKTLLFRRMKQYGLPRTGFLNYKPWFAAMTLVVIQLKSLGYSESFGVDFYLYNRAKGTKEIEELEGAEFQLKLFERIPDQDLFLRYSLAGMDELDESIGDLVQAWKTGDVDRVKHLAIDKPLQDYPDQGPIFELLFFDRNETMADKIEEMIGRRQDYFVVVGSGHLVGGRGIVGLLRSRGYEAKQL